MKKTTDLDTRWYKSLYFADSGTGNDRIRTHVIQPKFTKDKVVEDEIKDLKKNYKQLRKTAVKAAYKCMKEDDFVTAQLWVDYIVKIEVIAKIYRVMINNAKTYEDVIKLQVDWGEMPTKERE